MARPILIHIAPVGRGLASAAAKHPLLLAGVSPRPTENMSTKGGIFVNKRTLLQKTEPYVWIAPSIILMSIFIIIPIGYVFYMAFSEVSRAGLVKGFAGMDNFVKVLNSAKFSLVLKNTVIWTIAVVVLSTVLGFILALLLNNEFKGRKIARAIVVFPWATTLVIQASVWKFIINIDYGSLNTLLKTLGIISTNINWTPTPEAFFAWEIACGIFVTIPFVCFTALSGLQSIDSSYYEAAVVDGATYWQKLFNITIPLVKPSLTVATVLNIIYVFNSFPIVWTITKGDPASRTDTLVTYLYKLAFYNGKQGEAAAVSVIGFLILLVCASVYMVSTLKKGDE